MYLSEHHVHNLNAIADYLEEVVNLFFDLDQNGPNRPLGNEVLNKLASLERKAAWSAVEYLPQTDPMIFGDVADELSEAFSDKANPDMHRLYRRVTRVSDLVQHVYAKIASYATTRKIGSTDRWRAKSGFVGRKQINVLAMRVHKKALPNGTLAQWIKADKPEKDVDPDTHETWYPEEWVKGRIEKWQPGRTTPISMR